MEPAENLGPFGPVIISMNIILLMVVFHPLSGTAFGYDLNLITIGVAALGGIVVGLKRR